MTAIEDINKLLSTKHIALLNSTTIEDAREKAKSLIHVYDVKEKRTKKEKEKNELVSHFKIVFKTK